MHTTCSTTTATPSWQFIEHPRLATDVFNSTVRFNATYVMGRKGSSFISVKTHLHGALTRPIVPLLH